MIKIALLLCELAASILPNTRAFLQFLLTPVTNLCIITGIKPVFSGGPAAAETALPAANDHKALDRSGPSSAVCPVGEGALLMSLPKPIAHHF